MKKALTTAAAVVALSSGAALAAVPVAGTYYTTTQIGSYDASSTTANNALCGSLGITPGSLVRGNMLVKVSPATGVAKGVLTQAAVTTTTTSGVTTASVLPLLCKLPALTSTPADGTTATTTSGGTTCLAAGTTTKIYALTPKPLAANTITLYPDSKTFILKSTQLFKVYSPAFPKGVANTCYANITVVATYMGPGK